MVFILFGCITTSICFPQIFKPSEDIDKYQRSRSTGSKVVETAATEIVTVADLQLISNQMRQAVQPHDEMVKGWYGCLNRLRGHVDANRPLYPEQVGVLVDMLDYITAKQYPDKWTEIMDDLEEIIHSILHDDVIKDMNKDGAQQN